MNTKKLFRKIMLSPPMRGVYGAILLIAIILSISYAIRAFTGDVAPVEDGSEVYTVNQCFESIVFADHGDSNVVAVMDKDFEDQRLNIIATNIDFGDLSIQENTVSMNGDITNHFIFPEGCEPEVVATNKGKVEILRKK